MRHRLQKSRYVFSVRKFADVKHVPFTYSCLSSPCRIQRRSRTETLMVHSIWNHMHLCWRNFVSFNQVAFGVL